MALRIRFFDNFRFEADGWTTNQFGTLRAAKLLALLGLSKRRKMSREDLADALWPNDFYDATRLRLRQEVFRLKKGLDSQGHVLIASNDDIAIDDRELTTDIGDLIAALAMPTDNPGRRRALEAALAETEGPFLRGWDDLWVIAERQAAEALRLRAVTALGEALLADSLYDDAVRIVAPAIKSNPTDEGLRMIAVQAHAAGGSLAAAVNEFQQFRRVLADHGQEPTEEAQTLATSIQTFGFPRTIPASPQYTVDLSLPHPIERMFGRTEELLSIESLLADQGRSRFVTLTGPGGIGKTRLAIEAAHTLRESFDQVGFVSLAELEDSSGFAAFMLERLGLQPPPNGDLLNYLAKSLGAGRILLVLDSAEHLMPAIGASVKSLLQASPRLSLLLTSRASLGVGGEHLIPVGPLDQAEGQNMLAELWAMQRSRAVLGAEDEALGRLAQRLDGYPLALKLAASRLRFLTPTDLEDQLRLSVTTLRASGGDFEDRHRSLDAALRDSVDALNDKDREALILATAFRGGLTLPMAERAIGPDAPATLERLLDRSLLMLDDRSARVRFRMLGPIREFVEETAGPQAVVRANAGLYVTMVAWLDTLNLGFEQPITAGILLGLDSEQENLQHTALVSREMTDENLAAFLLRVWPYEAARGRQATLLGHLDFVWPRMEQLQPSLQAALLLARSFIYMYRSREAEGEIFLSQAEDLAASLGNASLEASASVIRSHYVGRTAMLQRGSLKDSAVVTQGAIDKAQALGNAFLIARAQAMAGYIAQFRNRHEEAVGFLHPAFDALQKQGEVLICGTVGLALSDSLRHLGRESDADRAMNTASAIVVQNGDPLRIAHMYETQGRVALARRRLEEAEWVFREALKFNTNIDNRPHMAYQLAQLSRVHAEQGLYKPSRDCLLQAAEYWREDGNLPSLCSALTGVARVYLATGDVGSAADAIAFAHAFQDHWKLELVSDDLDDRATVEAAVKGVGNAPADLSVTAAMAWFERLAKLDL